MLSFLEKYQNNSVIKIKAIPKASKNAIGEIIENRIKVYITVVPEKGKANAEIIKFFSKLLKVPKGKIHIIAGETSHTKNILIEASVDQVEIKFQDIFTKKIHATHKL